MSKAKKITQVASALLLVASSSSFAATEIIEDGLEYRSGPTYGSMMLDTVIGRPLQGVVTAAGALTWLVSLPFSLTSDSVEESAEVLVKQPASEFFQRCLGCTPEQDRTRRATRQTLTYVDEPVVFYEGDTLDNNGPRVVVHPYQH